MEEKLFELDEKVKKWMLETEGNGIFDVAVVMQFYDFIKPLISSMLQEKDEENKRLHETKEISRCVTCGCIIEEGECYCHDCLTETETEF